MPDIYAIKEKWEEDLMRRKGVIGVGIGDKEIVVFVEPDFIFDPSFPLQIEGIPVRIEVTEKFQLY